MKKTLFVCAMLLSSIIGMEQNPEFVTVEGGSFIMGDTFGVSKQIEGLPTHMGGLPAHQVSLSTFRMSKTEVTVAQYRKYCTATGTTMPQAPKWGWNDNDPIVNVSWQEAISYCEWLGKELNANITLPTEAQWEYAARGGKLSKGYRYSGGNDISNLAWYDGNSGRKTHGVGTKKANELGLYDMTGNVWEWCFDWLGKDYYKNSPETDPKNTSPGERARKVVRGGAWSDYDSFSYLNLRNSCPPADKLNLVGFRVVAL